MTGLEAITRLEAELSEALDGVLDRAEELLRDAGATDEEIAAEMDQQKLIAADAYRDHMRHFLRLVNEPDAPSLTLQ